MVKYQKKEGKGEEHMKKKLLKRTIYTSHLLLLFIYQRLQFELQ